MLLIVVEVVRKTRDLGTRIAMEKWDEGKLNMAFLHFLPNFYHFD